MTADDMVAVPRELAERLLESAIAWNGPEDTALQLAAILDPPKPPSVITDEMVTEALDRIPEADWKVASWVQGHAVSGDVDPAARRRLARLLLQAAVKCGWTLRSHPCI